MRNIKETELELSDNRIIYINSIEDGYLFVIFSKNKKIDYVGKILTKENLNIKRILSILFGYFDINDNEIDKVKYYKEILIKPELIDNPTEIINL